jgi:hypothetical protein
MIDDPAAFTADLLTGQRSHIDDPAPIGSPGLPGGGTRGPGDDAATRGALFADVRAALDEIDQLRATDPAEARETVRSLLSDPTLSDLDVASFIDVWRTATSNPQEFARRVEPETDDGDDGDGTRGPRGPRSWWSALRGFLHRPRGPSSDDRTILEGMGARYRLPRHELAPPVNPHQRLFETLDPAWVPLLRAKLGEKKWPKGLDPMRRHDAARPYVYPALAPGSDQPLAAGVPHTVALFSDFGTGYYHSWGIAEQLTAWSFPYMFHLGDVYYAGNAQEFKRNFELPLFDVVRGTRLFGLVENHELYAGGSSFLQYFDGLRAHGQTQQESSYFCVRFPHHQIIGLDTNWQGRRRYPVADKALHDWLRARLAEAGDRTTILLTGDAPFDHGKREERELLVDLWPYLRTGAIALWFWGDDHYAALYDRRPPSVPFYGSCIGHAGFPGPRQKEPRPTYLTEPLWLEDQARFPAWTHLRQDTTNNGWCQMTLRPDGGVDLLYVDWLWCKRAAVSFHRRGPGLEAGPVQTFDREDDPTLHVPPG